MSNRRKATPVELKFITAAREGERDRLHDALVEMQRDPKRWFCSVTDEFVTAGGLMSYGADFGDAFQQAAPVCPECPPRCPDRSEAFVVSDRILDDESLNPFRMCQCHAKANGPAVVLHIQRVVRQAHRLCEIVDHGSDVVERIIEPLRVRPFAVSEARVIGRDKVITIGKPGEERLEHPR